MIMTEIISANEKALCETVEGIDKAARELYTNTSEPALRGEIIKRTFNRLDISWNQGATASLHMHP